MIHLSRIPPTALVGFGGEERPNSRIPTARFGDASRQPFFCAQACAHKRGRSRHVPLDNALVISDKRSGVIVTLDDALNELARFDPRKSRIVELRFFGGLSVEETAEVLKVSAITVMREWS
jgi:hypothetical protein